MRIGINLILALSLALAACSRKSPQPAEQAGTRASEASPAAAAEPQPSAPSASQPEAAPRGHTSEITVLAFSRDGRWLASGSLDNTIRIWDASSGAEQRKLSPHEGVINTLAFSPDGRRLASGGRDGTVTVTDVRSGSQVYKLGMNAGEVTGVAFSPDGRYLIASAAKEEGDAVLSIFRAAGGDGLRQITVEWDAAVPLVITRDGRLLSSGTVSDDDSKRGVFIWDLPSGRLLKRYPILADAISSDGRWAAWVEYAGGPKIVLFDLDTGKAAHTLVPPYPAVMRLEFTQDGRRILATERDGSAMTLWDTVTGAEVQKLAGEPAKVTTVAFSSDGKLVAAAGYAGYAIKIWDLGEARLVQTFPRESEETAAGLSRERGKPGPASRP